MKYKQAEVSCQTGAEIRGKFQEILKSLQRQVPSCTALMPQHRFMNEINYLFHLKKQPYSIFRYHSLTLTKKSIQADGHSNFFPGYTIHTETTSIMRGEIFRQLEETVTTGHTGALDLPKNNAEVIREEWQLPA